MQCDPKCSQYKPCISACPVDSCDNSLVQGKSEKLCVEDTCVEGCQLKACPEGHIYSNDTYSECIPMSVCKPVCLQKDNVIYYEGDVTKKDNCHTCRCSKGKELCVGVPCPEKSIIPYHHATQKPYQDSNAVCISGWTPWINQDQSDSKKIIEKGEKYQKIGDTEPLPSFFLLKNLGSSASCSYEFMKQIECRTINTHINPKQTGEDAECSLEKGLLCAGLCHDYEIRVMCDCDDNIEIFTLPTDPKWDQSVSTPRPSASQLVQSTTIKTPAINSVCDPTIPHIEFPGDCYKFLHCQPMSDGSWKFAEKTCGPSMMFNPISMTCDWPSAVKEMKPNCGLTLVETTTSNLEIIEIKRCPPGKVWSDCAVPCGRTCHYYGKFLHRNGACLNGHNVCEGGCVDEDTAISCPLGHLWRDNKICVSLADCTCESDDGKFVKVICFENHCSHFICNFTDIMFL